MKKALIMLLCAALALSLAACGEAGTEETAPVSEPASEETAPVSEPAAEETAPATEPAAEETAPADEPEGESLLETAKTFEGAPVEDLIAAIGEPESSDYAPSCLGEGEDGNLYYDGFTVYTYRDTDGSETVSYVE